MRPPIAPRKTPSSALAVALVLATTAGSAMLAPVSAQAASSAAVVTAPAQTMSGFGASGAWWVNDLANFSSST